MSAPRHIDGVLRPARKPLVPERFVDLVAFALFGLLVVAALAAIWLIITLAVAVF